MESSMTSTKRPTLCIGVLTMNEANRIAQCIESAKFADQIVVIDSGSIDRTQEIAKDMGVEVHCYADWQGFAVQRTRLLKHVTTDYIFFLDADEVIGEALADEIRDAVGSGRDAIWEVLWNQVAYGRPLTLMKSTAGVQRLFKTASIEKFEGVVHEGAIMRGGSRPIIKFREKLLHYSRETVHGSLLKLAQYVQHGAAKRAQLGRKGGVLRGVASAFAIFIKLYFFRRGFLCGAEGFLFCFFIALECFFRYAALKYDFDKPEFILHKR
jgi:glycosyltransferase involved in cell wall biosynthesis